jgi:hypothetical protein
MIFLLSIRMGCAYSPCIIDFFEMPLFLEQEYALFGNKRMSFFSIASCGIPTLGCLSIRQEVDPCKSITDEDIRTTIENSGGPKGAMFLPEVCH